MRHIERVLVADDDVDDFEVLEAAIKEIPLPVVLERAENGEILLKILSENVPDLLFLDILMPCKDGKQCLLEIRSNKKYDLLPIVIYSSIHFEKDVEFCFRNGANIYAIKSGSLIGLKVILDKIFSIDWKKSMYYPPFPQFVMDSRSGIE
jgi:CheY-like chemotaxis protein